VQRLVQRTVDAELAKVPDHVVQADGGAADGAPADGAPADAAPAGPADGGAPAAGD
jgi:hypothetical protein